MECTAIPMVRNYRAMIRAFNEKELLDRHASDNVHPGKDRYWREWRHQMKIELSRRGLGS